MTKHTDGDTLWLSGVGKVRLIGVDTPEVYGQAECYGREASAFVERTVPLGSEVRYRLGVDERDRYGRALAYIWLPDGRFLNRMLVARGYAQPLTVPPNVEYEDLFVRARPPRARGAPRAVGPARLQRLGSPGAASRDGSGRRADRVRGDRLRAAARAVHGAGSARWSFDLLAAAPRGPVHGDRDRPAWPRRLHRRGRATRSRRECDDVAAVVRDAGEGAMLFGHSYGGLVAAGAALRLELPRLALYEPAMGGGLTTEETIERWERLIEEGERDTVTREFLREIGGYRRRGDRPARRRRRCGRHAARSSDTLPRELRAELAHRIDDWPSSASSTRRAPARGSESPAWAERSVDAHAGRIPRAEKRVLQGQGHGANLTAPELLAAELERFFAIGSDVSREP